MGEETLTVVSESWVLNYSCSWAVAANVYANYRDYMASVTDKVQTRLNLFQSRNDKSNRNGTPF